MKHTYSHVDQLPLEVGDKIKLYVDVGDGGASMGAGTEGKPEYLIEVFWNGPIYSGVMGCVKLLNGRHLGIPISAKDILVANPELADSLNS